MLPGLAHIGKLPCGFQRLQSTLASLFRVRSGVKQPGRGAAGAHVGLPVAGDPVLKRGGPLALAVDFRLRELGAESGLRHLGSFETLLRCSYYSACRSRSQQHLQFANAVRGARPGTLELRETQWRKAIQLSTY